MSTRLFTRLLLLAVLFAGCHQPAELPIEPDFDYFPLETGRYFIYEVEETKYSTNAPPVQVTYQRKETIGSAYTDVTGQTAYLLLRYRRPTEKQAWQADSIWSARLVNNEAIRSENGQDFVSLLFPVRDGLTWNGNRYNKADQDVNEARNVGRSFSVLGNVFTQTAKVVAQDDSTLVLQEKRIAVYARHIGLIYKEQTNLHFCTDTPACIGKNQIDYGIRQVYRIKTYGKE